MGIKIIYEDNDVLVVDKPAGIETIALINSLSKQYSGLKKVHRLDKDTSGALLIAKNDESLIFLQKQFTPLEITSDSGSSLSPESLTGFKTRRVEKKYLALIVGNLKNNQGRIETLIGRSPKDRKKQKVYLLTEPGAGGKREAITEYKVLEKFKDYTLLEVSPKTGRKHQIRCHLAYLGHPIVGDKMYGFKNQVCPKGLKRQFLHASHIKINLPDGKIREFNSDLSEDLKLCLQNLKYLTNHN